MTITTRAKHLALALAVASGFAGVAATQAPASAQYDPNFNPGVYDSWRPGWDRNQYDRRHVMLGTVANFQPYRLTVARRNGVEQTIDLKNGTIIRPNGATPQPGQHVAVVGYYSQGTFVANRVILRY